MEQKSRLLITGYPGWLTQRFLDTLSEYSICFDKIRCLTQPGVSIPEEYKDEIECVSGDLRDLRSLERATENIDLVLNTAGIIHVKKISDFYDINQNGIRNLLKACVKNKVQKVVLISSNAAQGFCSGPEHYLSEADPCKPENDYGRSKWEGERVVQEFQASGKIQTVIIRPSMFYGPPVPPRHINIFKKIQKGHFYVFGSGNYSRSVVYIDNLIQAIHLALSKSEANGQVYNITDREVPTLVELLQTMAESMGAKLRITRLPKFLAKSAEILDKILSSMGIYWMLPHIVGESYRNIAYHITKAEQELGYEPKVSYKEGYARTIQWCREHNKI